MTDAELRDKAVAELRQTTRGLRGYTPVPGSRWKAALDLLAQIGAAPPPPSGGVAAPVGPFTVTDRQFAAVYGIEHRSNGGGTISKQHIKQCRGYGILDMDWQPPGPPSGSTTVITDCKVEDVRADPPMSMDGTGEAGFWFANRTRAQRFTATRCSWMGMWTGQNCNGSTFEDFTIDQCTHVGLYVEHVTQHSLFRRFDIQPSGSGNASSVNIEWWYGGQGSHDLLFENGRIYCPTGSFPSGYGVFADAGTFGCTFRNIEFWGPGNAVCLPNKRSGAGANVVEGCTFKNAGSRVTFHDNAIG